MVNLKQQVEWKLNGSQHLISLTKTSTLSRFGWSCSPGWPKQGTIPLCYSYPTVTSSLYLFVQKRYPLINFHYTTTLLAMNFWREISKKERITPVILILFWFRFFFLDKDGIIFSVPWESKIIEYFVLPTRVTHAEIRYLLTSIIFWMTLDVFSFVVFVIACLFLFFSFSRVTEVFLVVFVSMNSFFFIRFKVHVYLLITLVVWLVVS